MASTMACSPMSSIIFLISTERSATSRSRQGVSQSPQYNPLSETVATGRQDLRLTDSDLNAVGAHELDLLHFSHGSGGY